MKKIDTILQIKLGKEYFGIDSDISNQILRVPIITTIPLTHNSLNGIVVLNGKIVPVVDMKQLLELGKVDTSKEESRIITLNIGSEEIAILVDEVVDALNMDENNFEANTSEDSSILGFYKHNEDLLQIIEPKSIIKEDMVESFTPMEIERLSDDEETQKNIQIDTNRFLFFSAQNEKFAVDIELVAELIFVPDEITHIVGMDKANLGAITLREEVIDVFDFNMLFGFAKVDLSSSKARIVILRSEGKKLALCVEDVEEIKDVDVSNIEKINFEETELKIESLYKNKKNIVSIISSSYLSELIDKFSVSHNENIEDKKDGSICMRELAVFGIDKEEFAFDIENVQEIIIYQEVTPVPDSDEYIEGIINLRGAIIPVVNLPKKLGFEPKITEKSKIIVCNLEDEKVGFLVDDVNDIMFIDDKYVSYSKNNESLTKSTISLENGKRVILELRIDKIISMQELQNIKED